MLQVVQNHKSGELRLETVPSPALKPGGVLVRTAYSLVSTGTESSAVRQAAMSMLGKARARPADVRKVLASARRRGVLAAYRSVMNRLDALTPLGYSLSGSVLEVGESAGEFRPGQRVACGGAGYANHAEVNFVPRLLVVPVPDNVSMPEAACTAVGSVALQGFRQSGLGLGDTVVVIGLGLIGQMYLLIARAAGCKTLGIDIDSDRVSKALELGSDAVCELHAGAAAGAVEALTGGIGADAVALAVGTRSNEPLLLAARLARDRARVVCIGKVRMDLPYEPFFRKDLQVVFSRSYGPGRYDRNYEEKGIDYPPGYVKWTERRNMMALLDLVAGNHIDLKAVVGPPVPFVKAPEVYGKLRRGWAGPAILFEYPQPRTTGISPADRVVTVRPPAKRAGIVLGCVGAGKYAVTSLLPALAARRDVRLKTVVTTRGTSCKSVALRLGFERAATDCREIFEDDEVNAVLIATPHDSHAPLVCRALRAEKAVFVEKPLAISAEQLAQIQSAVRQTPNDRLQVGFNRRFAPLARRVREAFADASGPLHVVMRVNAGSIAPGHWTSDPEISGGRFVGEGCHFVDLASFFVGEDPVEVQTARVGPDSDGLSVLLRYPGGSVATIVYVACGCDLLAKEHIEVHRAGRSAVLMDFRSAILYGRKTKKLRSRTQDKGRENQLKAFCEAVLKGTPMPIPLESLVATTRATLQAVQALRTGRAQAIVSAAA